MEPLPRMTIQIGIILVPIVAFLRLKKNASSIAGRLGIGMCLAVLGGGLACYFAAEYQWRPFERENNAGMRGPLAIAAIMTVTIFMALLILTISKRWGLEASKPPNQSTTDQLP